jgi:hypothetical protein
MRALVSAPCGPWSTRCSVGLRQSRRHLLDISFGWRCRRVAQFWQCVGVSDVSHVTGTYRSDRDLGPFGQHVVVRMPARYAHKIVMVAGCGLVVDCGSLGSTVSILWASDGSPGACSPSASDFRFWGSGRIHVRSFPGRGVRRRTRTLRRFMFAPRMISRGLRGREVEAMSLRACPLRGATVSTPTFTLVCVEQTWSAGAC